MPFYLDDSLETPEEPDDPMLSLEDYCTVYGMRDRELAPHEVREIESLEGIRRAERVAQEFSIGPARVRAIWDGYDG